MSNAPALKGDGEGHYRICVYGNTGSGKSSCTTRLASMLSVPRVDLDQLLFQPNWKKVSPEGFRRKLQLELGGKRSWIIDGNYWSRSRDLTEYVATTDVIWLDPPFMLYFTRLIRRTFRRIRGTESQCAPGCRETWKGVFLRRDSILWWGIRHHWPVKRRLESAYAESNEKKGPKWRRLGGWGSEAREWFASVEKLSKSV